jgi:hypothetical protein
LINAALALFLFIIFAFGLIFWKECGRCRWARDSEELKVSEGRSYITCGSWLNIIASKLIKPIRSKLEAVNYIKRINMKAVQ